MAHPTQESPLEPGTGPVRGAYVPAEVDDVLWGRLPCATDSPVLKVEAGDEVTFDTISHEGILEDQGRDPRAFFAPYDVPVLSDAVALAASDVPRTFGADGPHVVSRPVAVSGARVGDLLAVTILETLPRVPYGVISNRHGKGALPGEFPRGGADVVSAFARVSADGGHGLLPLTEGAEPTVSFPLAPFLGIIGVAAFGELVGPLAETREFLVPTGLDADLDGAVQSCVRAAVALLQARFGMDPHLALAYLSAATDFEISQVVDVVKGVHAQVRKADFAGVAR